MIITRFEQLNPNLTYSYADYLRWQFKERVELLRGKIWRMSPAPNMKHKRISGNLHGLIWGYLFKNPCQVFAAPFDVRLPRTTDHSAAEAIFTVVQPDLSVICDPRKLDDKGCLGAPDLVVEILSPGNSRREMKEKFELYQEAGVQEYWLVNPEMPSLLIYMRDSEGNFIGKQPLTTGDTATTTLLPGLEINLEDIFAEPA